MDARFPRRSSVRADLLGALFLSGLIPVFIAILLLYSQLHVSEQEAMVERERSAQQVRGALASLLHSSQSACDGVTFSTELNDFIQAPEALRRFSENRLYGRITEWEKRSRVPIAWMITDQNKAVIFEKGNEIWATTSVPSLGIALSPDKKSIQLRKEIHFDDQGLAGPNARSGGSIACSLRVDDLKRAEPRLGAIESIPENGNFNDVKILLNEDSLPKKKDVWALILTVIVFLIAATSAGFLLLQKRVLNPLEELTRRLGQDRLPLKGKKIRNEIQILEHTIAEYLAHLEKRQGELVRQAEVEALAQVSNQVAHDIRSPLAALEMVLKDLSHLPEQQRLIVRSSTSRIRDISNDLLNRNDPTRSVPASVEVRPELISAMVELIVTEKRMQYRGRTSINIEADLGEGAYGLFSVVSPPEFKRVISNLVNNAVEAMESGEVIVSVRRHDDVAIVRVADSGRGMSAEVVEQLGKRAFSQGKEGTESGSGLGLYHAFKAVSAWGGAIEVESKVGVGTAIILNLIAADQPAWFLGAISLSANEIPVVIDDDASVLQAWKVRFEQVGVKSLLHFSSLDSFSAWFGAGADSKRHRFFFDYEFLGAEESGLDFVERMALTERSILVTSRFEEEPIRARVKLLKMRLLPKGLVAYVPIRIGLDSEAAIVDAVLVDGDLVTQSSWKHAAKRRGVKLACFTTGAELLERSNEFAPSTKFYIDSNLGTEKGEDIAKVLFGRGFANLFLATGYPASHFKEMPWIKGILGKAPPWL